MYRYLFSIGGWVGLILFPSLVWAHAHQPSGVSAQEELAVLQEYLGTTFLIVHRGQAPEGERSIPLVGKEGEPLYVERDEFSSALLEALASLRPRLEATYPQCAHCHEHPGFFQWLFTPI
jgi:hypothetical protein